MTQITRSISRRQFVYAGLALYNGAPARSGTDNGVVLGVASYSFRQIPLEASIAAMKNSNIRFMELWDASLVPHQKGENSAAYTKRVFDWRLSAGTAELRQFRNSFEDAGIRITALTAIIRPSESDEEVGKVFDIAKAMGTDQVFSTTNLSLVSRLNTIAAQKDAKIAVHNHSVIHPDEFATPEDFAAAMEDHPRVYVNLDIGHFFAAGYDPVSYIAEHHDRILGLHLKDRKKNQGPNVPFGQGDTPVREVLQLLKNNRYPIPAMIEYEYAGADSVEEVRRSYEYCLNSLA